MEGSAHVCLKKVSMVEAMAYADVPLLVLSIYTLYYIVYIAILVNAKHCGASLSIDIRISMA